MTQSSKYLIFLFGCSITTCLAVFCINLFFDPLWYNNGNQLDGINYMFDERLSKANQYVKRESSHDYNCIILGSSRTTLFNESLLDSRYRCYNFSFSGGRIQEFVAWAKWLKNRGENPKYVILGIDDFNFLELDTALNIPDFIKNDSDPPSVFYSYLSLDALDMSIRLLLHTGDSPKIYDSEFRGTVIQAPPKYHPSLFTPHRTLDKEVVNDYHNFRKLFPHSVFVTYVPPVSSWLTASKTQEELDFYLHSLYTMSSFFDETYDFSIPGEVTGNPENTYDGGHYFPSVQKEIVKRINGEPTTFGVHVNKFSRKAYIENYRVKVDQFRKSLKKR